MLISHLFASSFNGIWFRSLEEPNPSNPWYITAVDYPRVRPPGSLTPALHGYNCGYCFKFAKDPGILIQYEAMEETKDLRDIIKSKAEKHSNYYRNLYSPGLNEDDLKHVQQMAGQVALDDNNIKQSANGRQRRTGVFEIGNLNEPVPIFKSVKQLRENYLRKLEATSQKLQDSKKCEMRDSVEKCKDSVDDSFLLPPPSGYCSSTASAGSDDERWSQRPQVRRSASSDSAVGLTPSDDEKEENSQQKVFKSPYSPRGSVDHVNVPSRTIIEAQYVPCPLDRKLSDCGSDTAENTSESRRHSCFTDDGEETPRCRYWRTPSVVVSDYSDDVMGLTLEDIEYFRNQRKENSSSPDSSLNSSCSNLNYCGSTISNLDAEYILRQPFRKSSDCSTCSTFSGDDETENTLPVPTPKDQVS